jgi:hypothetical protein
VVASPDRFGSSWATLALAAASLLIAVGGLELTVRILDLWSEPRALILGAASDPGAIETPALGWIPHPFLGWQLRPGRRGGFLKQRRREAIFGSRPPSEWVLQNGIANRFGFLSSVKEYEEFSAEDYVVGIFGGSVATGFASIGGEALMVSLEKRFPHLKGRISILNLASPTYKQPQQFFALAQMLLLGVPFDLIINLDGFNEVVFGGRDAASGYHPVFPGSAHFKSIADIAGGNASGETIGIAAAILSEREAAVELTQWFGDSLLRHLEFAKVLGGLLLQHHQRRAVELEVRLEALARESAGTSQAFRQRDPCEGEGCMILVADVWERASRLMTQLARGAGAEYLHVLQPNQYVEGSKILSDVERANYYQPERADSRLVRVGYPRLQERGRHLLSEGIGFSDLSGVFSERSHTTYSDACCHYNAAGYEILARAVAELVRGPM